MADHAHTPRGPHTLSAADIIGLACTICEAAAPPGPDPDPTAPIDVQAAQEVDWCIDSDYVDEQCSISIGLARDGMDGPEGLEVVIVLVDAPEEDSLVFVGYDFGEGLDDSRVTVERLTPGPWIGHLVTVARRACAVIEARGKSRRGHG